MQACHILLGRPWQFDRSAIHDGQKNVYKILKHGKSYSLSPLRPCEVTHNQNLLAKSYVAYVLKQQERRELHQGIESKTLMRMKNRTNMHRWS